MGLCELYGFDPLYLANEGKMMIVIAKEDAGEALHIMQQYETGRHARVIGSVTTEKTGMTLMKTSTGSSRILSKLAGEQLPRIC